MYEMYHGISTCELKYGRSIFSAEPNGDLFVYETIVQEPKHLGNTRHVNIDKQYRDQE